MSKTFSALAVGGLLAGLLAAAPIVMAAEQGSTSGPAAGSNVKPGTAVQKEDMGGASTSAGQSGVAAGAPGVAGQPGNKSGPPAKRSAGSTESKTR